MQTETGTGCYHAFFGSIDRRKRFDETGGAIDKEDFAKSRHIGSDLWRNRYREGNGCPCHSLSKQENVDLTFSLKEAGKIRHCALSLEQKDQFNTGLFFCPESGTKQFCGCFMSEARPTLIFHAKKVLDKK